MYARELIESARKLRLQGKTYSDIQKSLNRNFHKSTLSYWFKDLKLTSQQEKILKINVDTKLKISQRKAWKINKRRRIIYLNSLKDKNLYLLPILNKDVQKLLLAMLYLGEGAKSKSTKYLSLGSSNSKIVKLYLMLLGNCFKIDNSKFRIRIQCRDDQNIYLLEKYWQNLTKIPKEQFYPTYVDKRSIGKPTLHKDYKGVCAVHYFDRSIQLELELLSESMIKYILKGL